MKILVMGGDGTVGKALIENLASTNAVDVVEVKHKPEVGKYDALHVAIPWQGDFVPKVRDIAKEYSTKLIIVHSTVPPGTTRALGTDAVHSPVQGQHDRLAVDMVKFTKWVGAMSDKKGREACDHMELAGFDARMLGTPETTETLKLLCLARYLHDLAFYENADEILGTFNVNPQTLNRWTESYNKGYAGTKWARSVLDFPGGKIGGKCVAQNSKILYDLTKNKGLARDLETFNLI